MNVLSLFSGAGGGDIAITHLIGHRIIGYVEIDDYCQRVIAQRIEDGLLPCAPIFGDIRAFIDQGYADGYKGVADVITGGFPCQPFSLAGKRNGEDDARNMWPETIECIRRIRPRRAFLENVPGLLSSGYFGRILGDLAEAGYDARWVVLSARDCGAPHKRERLWMLAYSHKSGCNGKAIPVWEEQKENIDIARSGFERGCVSYGGWRRDPADDAESGLGRMVNGVAYRVDRIKAIGNGQVSCVAATAWNLLIGRDA